MYVIATGDIHLTARAPSTRKDDYIKAQWSKMLQILELYVKYKKKGDAIIIFPGDVFDRPGEPDWVMVRFLNMFMGEWDGQNPFILAVFGQHDLRYHSTQEENTHLAILEAVGLVHLLSPTTPYKTDTVHFYGAGWNDALPRVEDDSKVNVLVTHRMVIDEKLWEGQEDYTEGHQLLRNTKFNLLVCGDNHKHFLVKKDKRLLINAGSIMRSTTAQVDHKPAVVVYNTDTKEHEVVHLEMEPSSEVFDLDEIVEQKERNVKLLAFVETLGQETNIEGLDFLKNLHGYMDEKEVPDGVRNEVLEIIRE